MISEPISDREQPVTCLSDDGRSWDDGKHVWPRVFAPWERGDLETETKATTGSKKQWNSTQSH